MRMTAFGARNAAFRSHGKSARQAHDEPDLSRRVCIRRCAPLSGTG